MKQIYTMAMLDKNMQNSMASEVEDFMKNFHDDPRFLSGWGHAYFCSIDGAPLIFDIKKPHEHICSICGKVYKGFVYDSCHTTMVRNLAAVTCLKSAILFRLTDNKDYIEVIKKIIGFYADNYESMAVHSKETLTTKSTFDVGGAGKIMPQGLNESIFLTRMLTAMQIAREQLDDNFIADVKEKLFIPASELLLPQKMHIHNIPCWINSALGMIGLFFNEKELIDEATVKPFNINEQVEKGVTDAGFWYEGSIHYNFFSLEGILNLLLFCKHFNRTMPEKTLSKIKNMLYSAYYYAFDNLSFPNPCDGWPNVGLKTYLYIYYMGYALFGDEILSMIKAIEAGKEPRQRVPLSEPYFFDNRIPVERVLYGPATDINAINTPTLSPRGSINMESSNSALLRNRYFNVFFKYGHQTKSHSHPDKMSIEVLINNKSFTRDLSNSGYTSELCNKWHRRNVSHTTCMVDYIESDTEHPGKLLSFNDTSVSAECIPQQGVKFIRSLEIKDNILSDKFFVDCKKDSQIDWYYHFNQVVDKSLLSTEKTGALEHYDYFFDCEKIKVQDWLQFRTETSEVDIALEPGMECYFAKTYSNPANEMRTTLIIRKYSNSANIEMKVLAK